MARKKANRPEKNTPCEVIIVPPELDAIEYGMQELWRRGDELIAKHKLRTPIRIDIIDGHGNLFIGFNFDLGELKPCAVGRLPRAAGGLFFLMKDSVGRSVPVKLQIGDHKAN